MGRIVSISISAYQTSCLGSDSMRIAPESFETMSPICGQWFLVDCESSALPCERPGDNIPRTHVPIARSRRVQRHCRLLSLGVFDVDCFRVRLFLRSLHASRWIVARPVVQPYSAV